MKTFYISIFLLIGFLPKQTIAQWLNCDNGKYMDSIYSSKLVNTVEFGENYTAAGKYQKLYMDVYVPENDTSEYRPVVVLAFGGAYIKGEKEDVKPVCKIFNARGYVCAAIDYRLFDKFVFPDSAVILDEGLKARADMIAAIKYLRWDADNENRWRINPDFIFSGGASSGSITALMTAYFNENDSLDLKDWMKPVLTANGGYEGDSYFDYTGNYNYNVSGVANMLGAITDLNYIDKGEPLHVGIHGTEDDVVPYGEGYIKLLDIPVFKVYGSSLVHQKALEENIHSSFISVDGGKHGDFLKDGSPWLDSMMNTTFNDFSRLVLCPEYSKTNDLNNTGITISPNPANDYLKISIYPHAELSEDRVLIYDIDGRLLINELYDNKIGIDIKSIPKGVYFVKIIDNNNRKYGVKMFVKALTVK